jgi:pyruvate/2-oxoglutarate/acetoin dehydrogenase E1 component
VDLARKPILQTIHRAMTEDPTIIIIGEGARVKASLDYPPLLTDFGDRIYTGPIAEASMVNMGLGASITGLRPIVDLIGNDFMLRATEEILNEVAKIHIMSGGKLHSKLLIKVEFSKFENAQSGSHWDYLFEKEPPPHGILPPELKVMVPKTVKESTEMIWEALHRDAPTLFFEDRLIAS